jgi:hypothetical protein
MAANPWMYSRTQKYNNKVIMTKIVGWCNDKKLKNRRRIMPISFHRIT